MYVWGSNKNSQLALQDNDALLEKDLIKDSCVMRPLKNSAFASGGLD